MSLKDISSRRNFLASIAAAASLGCRTALAQSKSIPVGLELYSVRDELQKDLKATVRGVAKMGYQCVEFFSPYFDWTPDYARQVRAELDDLGLRCYSTHNLLTALTPEGIGKVIELNHILGTHYLVLAYPGEPKSLDDWKRVAEALNQANLTLQRQSLRAGYHNHEAEWKLVEGQKPMALLASALDKSVMLQLDVGTCLAAGGDPVAWIKRNPGRIRSIHLKDWSPQIGYKALFGEGVAPWKNIFAAEQTGGIEFYLIEQEGSRYSEMETAERCLTTFRKLRHQA